jgi:ornithine carbamoyltransferase
MLSGRDLLTLADLTSEELRLVLDTAHRQKGAWSAGERGALFAGAGMSAALVFLKPSVRTRASFEVACSRLGVAPMVLGPGDAFSRGETVADTTRVLERYCDAIIIRAFEHSMVEEIADAARVPVVNALTDDFHPCQGLADLLTIEEHKGRLDGVVLAYIGDGNNVVATLLLGGALTGMHVRVASPEGYEPSADIVSKAREMAVHGGGTVTLFEDPVEAVAGADVVYTDTWASMGQEDEHAARVAAFAGYTVDQDLMDAAGKDAVFMHCLPAHRGEEVTDQVIDAPYSVVFDQAENRLHAQQALLALLMG